MSRPTSIVRLRVCACLTALFALFCNLAAPAALTFGAQRRSAVAGRATPPPSVSASSAALGSYPVVAQTQSSNIRQLPLTTNDIVFDKKSQKIFASVPSRAGVGGNSVTAVEPRDGLAEDPVFV